MLFEHANPSLLARQQETNVLLQQLQSSMLLPKVAPSLDFGMPILADRAVVEKERADRLIVVLVLFGVPKACFKLRNILRFQRSYCMTWQQP